MLNLLATAVIRSAIILSADGTSEVSTAGGAAVLGGLLRRAGSTDIRDGGGATALQTKAADVTEMH